MRYSATDLMEWGYIPDWLIRIGIRWLLKKGLPAKVKAAERGYEAVRQPDHDAPVEFWQNVLGPRLYYSACWWPKEVRDLETAGAAMLAFMCERAELGFDQGILDFGCGWGALTLWIAEFYPDSRVVAASDSSLQREFIAVRCREKGLNNVQVIAIESLGSCDSPCFDRVMLGAGFESMRAYSGLGKQIDAWLKPGGKLFLHGVTSRQPIQPRESEGDHWLECRFGEGSLLSADWLPLFQDPLQLEEQWHFDGRHYQRTLNAWLAHQDRQRAVIMSLLRDAYGPEQAVCRFRGWRFFFMAHAEAFGYRAGQQWMISHYRFVKP